MSGGEIVAGEAVKQIARVLDTAMESPSKEIGNYIADKIRFLRYNSLIKIINKAERKAREEGMSLKMPPLKFFVPFCEAASLEEADKDETLADLWANVLINAQKNEGDSRSLLYLRILKEITAAEAIFLRALVEEGRAEYLSERFGWNKLGDMDSFDAELIEIFIDGLPSDFTDGQIITSLIKVLECPGLWFNYATFYARDIHDQTDYFFYQDFAREDQCEGSVQVLESLGIVTRFSFTELKVKNRKKIGLWCDGIKLTKLGRSFYGAVTQQEYHKDFKKHISSDDDYLRMVYEN